ncbi:MAG: DUF6291 domain-containing protein [Lachnospiraceae bacterium]|nr:DUF6291 domain-containing protein [Lachnospiraceae bacterium]
MAEGFVFYQSFAEALEVLPDDQYGKAARAIIRYALYDEMPEALEAESSIVFIMAKPQIDANTRRRENGKKGAKYGNQGGRPPKNPIGDNTENPIGDINPTSQVSINKSPKGKRKAKNTLNNTETNNEAEKNKDINPPSPFTPPTWAEVMEYCFLDGRSHVDPNIFYDTYNSIGWIMDGEPIDWKAKIKEWEEQAKEDDLEKH